jgi:DNA-binding GntR family transcriptional regulator
MLARLDGFCQQMDEAVRHGQPQAMVDPDVGFHRQLVAVAGSRQLLAAWERLAGLIAAILGVTDLTYRDLPNAVHGHQLIVGALRERDGAAAEAHIQAHLGNGERVMREAMKARALAELRSA